MIHANNQVGYEVQILIPKTGWQFYVSTESQIFSNVQSAKNFMKTVPQHSGFEFRVYDSLYISEEK